MIGSVSASVVGQIHHFLSLSYLNISIFLVLASLKAGNLSDLCMLIKLCASLIIQNMEMATPYLCFQCIDGCFQDFQSAFGIVLSFPGRCI